MVESPASTAKQYYFTAGEQNTNFGPFTYTWTLFPPNSGNPSLYTGQITPNMNFYTPGYYTMQLKKQSPSCGQVLVNLTFSAQDPMLGLIVEASPNPANTLVEVVYETGDSTNTNGGTASRAAKEMADPATLSVFNTQGVRLVQQKSVGDKRILLDVSALPNGVYILEVTNQRGMRGVKKLLVQH